MARIGIAGIQHETNTFAGNRAHFRDFVMADAWPGLAWRDEVPGAVAGANVPAAGAIEVLQAAGHQVVPLLWASANPCGPVTEDSYEALWWLFDRALGEAGPLDGLVLELHGAMVAEHHASGDSEWLRRVRDRLGRSLPVVVALDFHANLTPMMAELADLILIYRTYPHVDMADCGREAARMLETLLAGKRYQHALRQASFLVPLPWQSTLAEPMGGLMDMAVGARDHNVAYVGLAGGFPLADVLDSAPAVLAYARTQSAADAAADRLIAAFEAARPQFAGRLWTVREAVIHAQLHGRPGAPVVLADTQDNPGGGGDGDTTEILAALLDDGAENACVGVICDPLAVAAAHEAGIGALLDIGVGGKRGAFSGKPVPGPWRVEALGTGKFAATGPFYAGCQMDLGPMARLSRAGIEVILSSRKQQAADRAMFRHVGVEPNNCSIIVLKSSVHFRADFGDLASEILVVAAAGPNAADLRQLTYRHCRRPPA